MNETIQSIVASTLLRTLQLEPTLTPSEAVVRVKHLLPSVPFFPAEPTAVHLFLQRTAGQTRRRGVLNPLWLSQARKIDLYYYLVRTQPGWAQNSRGADKGVSTHLL